MTCSPCSPRTETGVLLAFGLLCIGGGIPFLAVPDLRDENARDARIANYMISYGASLIICGLYSCGVACISHNNFTRDPSATSRFCCFKEPYAYDKTIRAINLCFIMTLMATGITAISTGDHPHLSTTQEILLNLPGALAIIGGTYCAIYNCVIYNRITSPVTPPPGAASGVADDRPSTV